MHDSEDQVTTSGVRHDKLKGLVLCSTTAGVTLRRRLVLAVKGEEKLLLDRRSFILRR